MCQQYNGFSVLKFILCEVLFVVIKKENSSKQNQWFAEIGSHKNKVNILSEKLIGSRNEILIKNIWEKRTYEIANQIIPLQNKNIDF
jgi:hypothetical protein